MPQPKLPEFETFIWSGQTRYRCSDCTYDHYQWDDVYEHWKLAHAPQITMSKILDPAGNPFARGNDPFARKIDS
jgi:hypothetical protein